MRALAGSASIGRMAEWSLHSIKDLKISVGISFFVSGYVRRFLFEFAILDCAHKFEIQSDGSLRAERLWGEDLSDIDTVFLPDPKYRISSVQQSQESIMRCCEAGWQDPEVIWVWSKRQRGSHGTIED